MAIPGLDPWTSFVGESLFGGDDGPSALDRRRGHQRKLFEAGRGPEASGSPILDMVNRGLFLRRGTGEYRRELKYIQSTLRDPAVSRFLSPAGREALFGDMSDAIDSSYRTARTAGVGQLNLSGLGDSAARGTFEGDLAMNRGNALANAMNQATVQHGAMATDVYNSLFQPLFQRDLTRSESARNMEFQEEMGRMALISGATGALGTFAGMGLGSKLFPAGG